MIVIILFTRTEQKQVQNAMDVGLFLKRQDIVVILNLAGSFVF
jgi:hypothetical protein